MPPAPLRPFHFLPELQSPLFAREHLYRETDDRLIQEIDRLWLQCVVSCIRPILFRPLFQPWLLEGVSKTLCFCLVVAQGLLLAFQNECKPDCFPPQDVNQHSLRSYPSIGKKLHRIFALDRM